MGHEAAAAKLAVEAVLPGTFFESAPQNAALPYKLCRQRSPGTDSQVISGVRAMTSPLVDVGIWVEWDPYSATAQAGAKEIDDAMESLRSYQVTDANGDEWEVSSRSEGGAWVREEIDLKAGGKKFYWVGRSYRLSISAA